MSDDTGVPNPERRFLDSLKRGCCFLCGAAEAASREHVFPKWLLRDRGLYNERLVLLNGTSIPYRSIVLPACEACNTKHLSPLETAMSTAVRTSADAVRDLGSATVSLWMAKVFYGLLHKESTIPLERATNADPIVSRAIMDGFSTVHDCLQYFRHRSEFHGRPQWSLFIFDCLKYGDERDFDYKDCAIRYVRDPESGEVSGYVTPACAMRVGSVGLIASFGDRGFVEEFLADRVKPLTSFPLHPIQFDELCARIFYQRGLFRGSSSTITMYHENDDAPSMILSPGTYAMNWNLLFKSWDNQVFVDLYLFYMRHWGLSREQLVTPDGLVLTFLENDADEPLVFPPGALQLPGEGVFRLEVPGDTEDSVRSP